MPQNPRRKQISHKQQPQPKPVEQPPKPQKETPPPAETHNDTALVFEKEAPRSVKSIVNQLQLGWKTQEMMWDMPDDV